MSTVHFPDDFDLNYHQDLAQDLAWRRAELALKSLTISDVLAEVDSLIASEPAEEQHPLYALAAHALDRTTQPGSAEGLMARYKCLIDHAVERLVEQRLADPASWED